MAAQGGAVDGAAQGAKVGAAFGPWGAAIGAGVGAATGLASEAMSGAMMGGASSALAYGTTLDTSAWTVNFSGEQKADVAPVRTTTMGPLPGTMPSSPALAGTADLFSAPGFTTTAGGGMGAILLVLLVAAIALKRKS